MKHRNHILTLAILSVWFLVSSCSQPGGDNPGSEFMPDMAHSVAYEANHYLYYYNNTWGSEEDYYKMAQPRKPVEGTIARGSVGSTDKMRMKSFSGDLTHSGISIPVNGSIPYAYADTEEDRTRAGLEIVDNPYPINDDELARAKVLYNTFCGICHGEKGDGAGYLVREDGGKYPAQPANLLLDQYVDMSNGKYYHAIIHGKNLMGGYADKLSNEERWQVIHYIRSLQAKEKKLAYNQYENTLNSWATPMGDVVVEEHDNHGHDGEHHDNDDHGHEDAHGDDHGHNDDHGHGDHH